MSWASRHIITLREKGVVEFRPRGTSMEPIVMDNELVRVRALAEGEMPAYGDVVLCTVNGRQYLHLVKAVQGERVLIGNNRGNLNGWTHRKNVFGVRVPLDFVTHG